MRSTARGRPEPEARSQAILLVDRAPDRHVIGERSAHPETLDRPATESHHGGDSADLTGERVERRDDQALLAATELGLALTLEERGDRLAELVLEQLVGVDHPQAESLGYGVRGPRLASRHESDEDDPVMRP